MKKNKDWGLKVIKSKFKVNEPLILAGKHRTDGEVTGYIEDDEVCVKLCKSGAITRLSSIAEPTEPFIKREPLKPVVIEDKAEGKEEFNARDSRRLDSHSNTKKKSKR